jgi:hypothetical protein
MNPISQPLVDKVNRVTAFMLEHRGRCFAGWTAAKVFRFVAWHILNGTLFVAFSENGTLGLVVIAWPEIADDVTVRARDGAPQFVWDNVPREGDCFLIADVAGNRKLMPDILEQVSGAWPDSPRKRLFTYRRSRLKEMDWTTIRRFTYGFIPKHS